MSEASSSTSSSPSSAPTISPSSDHSATALALGISLAVLAALVFGGLALYFVRRRHKAKHARARAEEIASHAHRRTYMVAVDPSHLAARVTPFGVGVNAPNVEVPKFGEYAPLYLLLLAAVGTGGMWAADACRCYGRG